MSLEKCDQCIDMLEQAKNIALKATIDMNRLKQHPAYPAEGMPELLRAQMQNAYTLASMSSRMWSAYRNEILNTGQHVSLPMPDKLKEEIQF